VQDAREIAEAMILVHRAKSDAESALLRVLFHSNDPDAADVQRLRAQEDAIAADMVVLERSPTEADVARVTAR
jgi:hypothetical protein